MFKIIQKDKNQSYDNISRQIFGTALHSGNFEKINNYQNDGEIIVYTNEDLKTSGNEFSLITRSGKFINFSEAITFNVLNSVRGAIFLFEQKSFKENNINLGEPVTVTNSSGEFLTGEIRGIYPIFNKSGKFVQVEIKSGRGILLDSDLPYPLEYTNLAIKKIIQNICGYWGQNVEFDDNSESDFVFKNEIGTSFTANLSEKALKFISRLASSIGLTVVDEAKNLKIQLIKEKTPILSLIENETIGIKSFKPLYNTELLGRQIEVNTQYPKVESATCQIPFPLPIIRRFDSDDFNADNINNIAKRTACRKIGEAFKIEVVLNDININLFAGDFVEIISETCCIYEPQIWIVEGVTRHFPFDVTLILTLPCAYTYEIPERLPLC